MSNAPTFEKNHNKNNYYLRSMQDKLNVDFLYRYDAFDIGEEKEAGSLDFTAVYEAAVTTAITDRGKKLSDDWKHLVFKDYTHYTQAGIRYRFSAQPDDLEPSIWLTTNMATTSPGSDCIVRKCNNFLGILINDNTEIHYEPCVVEPNMQYVNMYYNDDVVISQATLYVILQHNQYTRNIEIDDRFIIGFNQVFKVKAVNNFLNVTTMDDYSAPTILLSLDKDTTKDTDDFELKITDSEKYNPHSEPIDNYVLHFDYNEDKVFIGETKDYICHLYNNGAEIFQPITFSIVNTEDNIVPIENYDFAITSDNTFTIKNKKMYNKAPLLIEAQVIINEQTIKDTIEIWLGGLF